jgi:hypothetical protein
MLFLGIIVGLLVWGVVGSFIRFFVLQTPMTGMFEGFVAGVWAAWPFIHKFRVNRYNFLHPVPKEYKLPVPQAFAKVRDILAESVYNYGDKWQIVTSDSQAKRIVANLRFTDEETKMEGDARGQVHTGTERVQRLLELDVQMKEVSDGTIVQIDFSTKIEGANISACDSIVTGLCRNIEASMGPGVERGSAVDTRLPAPPWWLVGLTVCALLGFFTTVSVHVADVRKKIANHPQEIQQEKVNQEQREQGMKEEMWAWQRFKEGHNLK